MNENRKPSVAIIGIGRMGQRHLQNIINLNFTVVGLYDVLYQSISLDAYKDLKFDDLWTASVNDLITGKKPDAIIISTTAPSHCEYTCLAAEHGVKYILCEKPMGVSIEECNRMISACEKHGAYLAINHQMRFMEQYTLPKRLLMSDEYGGLQSITVIGGNFGLAMNGTHYFEMFRFMTDEEPDTVTAWFSDEIIPNPRGPQFEDRAGCIRVTTRSGKRLYMDVSSDQGHGVKVIYSGKYGQIIVDELTGTMITGHRTDSDRMEPTTRYGLPSSDSTARIVPADSLAPSLSVFQALISNRDYPDGKVGRLAVKTLVAAYISHENGHIPVKINETEQYQGRIFPWA